MISTQCPYCYHLHTVADAGPLRCTACGHFFEADPYTAASGDMSPTLASPVPGPACMATCLTQPHRCHQCSGAIDEATGLQRSTRLCPLCHKKTSIYARIYYCSECRTLLESPAVTEGLRCRCPRCGRGLTVPRELAFHDRNGEMEADWFGFNCPDCNQLLHSRRDCARALTICPKCRQLIHVPDHGFAEPTHQRQLFDEPEKLPYQPMRRCPRCQMAIPLQARGCPYCRPIS